MAHEAHPTAQVGCYHDNTNNCVLLLLCFYLIQASVDADFWLPNEQ